MRHGKIPGVFSSAVFVRLLFFGVFPRVRVPERDAGRVLRNREKNMRLDFSRRTCMLPHAAKESLKVDDFSGGSPAGIH